MAEMACGRLSLLKKAKTLEIKAYLAAVWAVELQVLLTQMIYGLSILKEDNEFVSLLP